LYSKQKLPKLKAFNNPQNPMKLLFTLMLLISSVNFLAQDLGEEYSIYRFSAIDVQGNVFDFCNLEGKKILIVNTASKCMFASQLRDLQKLYEKYKDKGFIVIAFPTNDFFNREPRSNQEIAKHYPEKYKISFPVMSKVSVKGDSIHPIYEFLTHKSENGRLDADVKWNFHKYLIDNQGHVLKSINPVTKPFNTEIVEWIEEK